MPEPAIIAENVTKRFGSVLAVNDLSFSAPAAMCFGLLGPNGAGKTTMMKMIYGKSRRDGSPPGKISVFGWDPAVDELAIKYVSGVVPQENSLDEELNVEQNLRIFARFYGLPRAETQKRIAELLAFMELSEKRTARIKELSGGMKRRLIIARALLNNPRLLILDEPTTGLDPQVRHLIWDKLRSLKKKGMSILLTTHYMEEAFQICDRILIMDKGRRIVEGHPHELLRKHIEGYVLEIISREVFQGIASGIRSENIRIDESADTVRLYANDPDVLRAVAHTLEPGDFYLRQANLEDLFLKATGRALNAAQ
ncbi:MAG: ATP-binding cassette domain-containing protein [Chitinivibrionales bacterium]|nr:ATP-binding cassette domain-containing protein [Chitinivibrionales bacterium]MBD3356957.1 ATP-binding cassette domain-containing protein [Chitinivibrionales bacterium]